MNDSNPLSDNVYLRHSMPLSVKMLTSKPEDSVFVFSNEKNEKVLSQVMTMDEFSSDSFDEDADHNAELVRLDHKLNLLLDMVGIMISTNISLPSAQEVTLYAGHIDWLQSEPLGCSEDTWLEIDVWLRDDYPKPFHLYVQFQSEKEIQNDEQRGVKVRCKYHGFTDGIVDQLEKIIFRHHRRVIAQSRNS